MTHVLVLNASWEPLSVVSVRRAIVLLLKEKAELVEAARETLRAERVEFPVPVVIRLVTYVRIPAYLGPPFSRRALLIRDRHTCQYCGRSDGPLTIDHVVPISRGGETTWDNVVAACPACNHRKGDRTPAEAGMTLRSRPARPAYVAIAVLGAAAGNDIWNKYIYP